MAKYQNHKFGDEALVPQGQPFRLAIEGVDREFVLKHRIDDDGQIRMSVDVADTDRRRSMQDAVPARRLVDDDDDGTGDFDSRTGVLKDGRSIRVEMTAMDGRGTPSDPLIINTPFKALLRREFHPDGTPRNRRDGSSRRARQADAAITAITQTDDHRPHFVDSDRSASEAARAEGIRAMCDAWRGPQTASPPAATADAAPPAGVSASDFARFQMIQEMSDAWRPRDADQSGLSVTTGAPTRPVTARTVDAYSAIGVGVNEGDTCTWNGAAGTVKRKGDWLFCEVHQPQQRSAPPSGDAAVGTRDAATGNAKCVAIVTLKRETPNFERLPIFQASFALPRKSGRRKARPSQAVLSLAMPTTTAWAVDQTRVSDRTPA